jgi:diguanylate cyclase (GGDEF)-like protein
MPPERRHRATPALRGILRRALRPGAGLLAMAATCVVIAAAGRLSAGAVLILGAATGAGSALTCAIILIRLALRIHGRVHTFGPCRGAGYLGLGTALAGATIVTSGAFATAGSRAAATAAIQLGTVAVAAAFVTGLLLLPGAAPSLASRLRHGLDGTAVGAALFLIAWLLALGPSRAAGGTGSPLLVGLLTCIALATTTVTGLRAAAHRPAAIACAGGSALVLGGLFIPAIGQHGLAWYALVGLALAAGPPLIVAGAQRGDAPLRVLTDRPIAGGLAAHPLLAAPLAAAITVIAYHALTGGRFDRVAIGVGLLLSATVTVRETLAALDVRRYAGRLASQQARFRALVAGSTDVTMLLDSELVVRWQSPAAARQLGLSDQDVLGRPFPDLLHDDDVPVMVAQLRALLDGTAETAGTSDPADVPVRARVRDGFGGWRDTEATMRDLRAAPDVGALVVHLRSTGDAGLQRQLDEMTRTDPLTGLANGRRLRELASTRLATGARGAIVVLAVHGLAGVNDLYGSAMGDAVLIEAARRLRGGVEAGDVVARLGGDRFGLLLRCSALRAYPRAGRLLTALTQPYELGGGTARLTADAGVADLVAVPRAEEALRHAELAADRAHERGPGRVEAYDEGLAAALRRRAAIEQRLPAAIAAGEFDLVYQPVLDLRYKQPIGVEALLRWRLPEFGAVPPIEVVAAAEELGCVADLDARVLRRACRQLARWRREGRDLSMAVNVSPRQLTGDGLPLLVDDALRRNDVPANRLVVEVAARDVPDDAPAGALAELRALGVQVALDHFGSGPVGLAQLPKLAVDRVKFDRSLFADPQAALVDVIVALGRRLSFDVAAVGVESTAELDLVRTAGCHLAQGRVLAAPTHAEHVEAFLEEHRARLT